MMTFDGIAIYPLKSLVVTRKRRVRGGYLNRWLVLETVVEPSPNVHVEATTGVAYAHPVTLARINLELTRRFPVVVGAGEQWT